MISNEAAVLFLCKAFLKVQFSAEEKHEVIPPTFMKLSACFPASTNCYAAHTF